MVFDAEMRRLTADLNPPHYVVVDTETTVRPFTDPTMVGGFSYDPRPYGSLAARPRVLCVGWMGSLNAPHLADFTHTQFNPTLLLDGPVWVVGHNVKFDHQHFVADGRLPSDFYTTRPVWDTMIAEYILTAQHTKFASLDELVKKYTPGASKFDLIGDNLAKGITPECIPPAELHTYCLKDVELTREVFVQQWTAASPAERRLITIQSMAATVYGDMEYAGLPLNAAECVRRRDRHFEGARSARSTITQLWGRALRAAGRVPPWWGGMTVAPDVQETLDRALATPQAISAYMFGRPSALVLTVKRPSSILGTGLTCRLPLGAPSNPIQPGEIDETEDSLRTKHQAWCTDEAVIDKICKLGYRPEHAAMAASVASMRGHSKLEKTYYQPLLEHAETYGDGRVHHTIHSTATNTGRTSSANPNLQNQPDKTREVFEAPTGHLLVEADFDQLEVIALAQVSGCAALQRALTTGTDIHYETGKEVFGWRSAAEAKADTDNRRRTKRVVFGLIYGGGSATLATQSGFPVETVRALIDGFYAAFPGVASWQEAYYDLVVHSPTSAAVVLDTARGCTVRAHTATSDTGRRYRYHETASPDWLFRRTGAASSFSPTTIKNYPIQGLATGDWVPLFLVLLRDHLITPHTREVKILNAVHDSVLLQVPRGSVEVTKSALHDAADDMRRVLRTLWNIDLFTPLTLTIKVGPTWSPRSDDDE